MAERIVKRQGDELVCTPTIENVGNAFDALVRIDIGNETFGVWHEEVRRDVAFRIPADSVVGYDIILSLPANMVLGLYDCLCEVWTPGLGEKLAAARFYDEVRVLEAAVVEITGMSYE